MINIENHYMDYNGLLNSVGIEKIEGRIKQIYQEMTDFLNEYDLNSVAYIHEILLYHAVMDYFSDVQRLKDFQEIEHINGIKIKAYETSWLLKRKPIQLLKQEENDINVFINEKFLLVRLASYLLEDDIYLPITDNEGKAFQNFLDTILYYLKFRQCDPQALEIMILGFMAGKNVEQIRKNGG